MNFVIIMTDTQNKSMVGAYGNPMVDTPNLDRLSSEGIRFERAYNACPLCTPARSAIFTGLHPQINGALCNNIAPGKHVAMMGTIFHYYGFRTAYTGKWHLDGTAYFGDGVPGGGFENDWWYDGKRYIDDIGPKMFKDYKSCRTADELRKAGFHEENIWGHRVANRAIDFLRNVGKDPFVLVVSFDEPHGPCVAPPEYWEIFRGKEIPKPPNFLAPLDNKPQLQRIQRRESIGEEDNITWENFVKDLYRFFGCNSYVDREIGRVIDTIDKLHPDDTVIIYTSDHGDQLGAQGLMGKGPMMYEEICNVPFIIRLPGGPNGVVTHSLISQVDIIPTMLDLVRIEPPELLNGVSFSQVLKDTRTKVRDNVLIGFHRYGINADAWGGFYPIRCAVNSRYKLAINLFDSDELYDLKEDPYETNNLIEDQTYDDVRSYLHDWLLEEMERIRDPFRSFRWANRPWRSVRREFYIDDGKRQPRPTGFPFQPPSIEG